MSDTLIAVIVGGFVASIVPITRLIFDYFRWKREAKLEQLRSERKRLETLYNKALKELPKALAEHTWPTDIVSDILILMPKEVTECIRSFVKDKDKTESKCRDAYTNITFTMKQSLSKVDKQIENLTK